MALVKIQHRRGDYTNYDPSKVLPGEIVVTLANDPNAPDGKAVYIGTTSGTVKQLATVEDMESEVATALDEAVPVAVTRATQRAEAAADRAEDAASTLTIDTTLTQAGQAAESKKVGDELSVLKQDLNQKVVQKPLTNPDGTNGQLLRTKGNGQTEWVDVGTPTDEQVGTAVSEWLVEHPEATTTVENGSLTQEKFTLSLKLSTVKDYVTPQMYGAVADGIHDDTASLNSSAQYAISNNAVLYIPKGEYLCSDDVNLRYVEKVVSDGNIILDSGKYLILGNTSVDGKFVDCYIAKATRVKVMGILDSHVFVGYANEMTLYANGDDRTAYSIGYNHFEGIFISNVKLYSDTEVSATNTGWISENTFNIRRIQHLYIGGNYPHNNNRFLNCCIEGSTSDIEIDNGHDNYISYRGEGIPLASIILGENTYNNMLVQTWTGTKISPYFYQLTSPNNEALKALNKNNFVGTERLFYANRGHLVAIDINHKCFTGMSGYMTANKKLYGYSGQTLYSGKPIRLPEQSPVQILFVASHKCFKIPNVKFYDESMTPVTITTSNVSASFTSGSYGTTTGNITDGSYDLVLISILDVDNIKYISFDIAVASGYNNEFDYIYADLLVSKTVATNVVPETDYAKNANTIPPNRGTWEVGEIVYNSAPASSGYIGWVCVEAGSPGTWKGFGQIA